MLMTFLHCLQTKEREGKIGSRQHILMLQRRPSHLEEKLCVWVVFFLITCG
jgi:hypothetical protein